METEKEIKKNGGARAGAGRPKGSPNRATTEFRETIAKLLNENAENMSIWLREVAAKNPGKALYLVAQLAEFAAPKFSRAEIEVEHSGQVTFNQITRRIIDTSDSQKSKEK